MLVYPKLTDSRTTTVSELVKNDKNILYGKKWYPNLVNKNGLYQNVKRLDYIVSYTPDQNRYLYTSFINEKELYDYIQKFKHKCFYEIINGPQKPKFDIDINLNDEKIKFYVEDGDYEKIKTIGDTIIKFLIKSCKFIMLPNILNDHDIYIYTSHGQHKLSFHVVINNWYHENNDDAYGFYYKVVKLTELYLNGRYTEFIDGSVYKTNQAFRLLGCHKYNTDRIKLLTNNINNDNLVNFSNSLITNTKNCTLLPPYKTDRKYNYYSYDLSSKDIDDINILLKKKFGDLFKIRDIKGNRITLIKNKSYYCKLCNRKHEHENPYIIVYNGDVKWGCRRKDEETNKSNLPSEKLVLGQIEMDNKEEEEDEACLCFGDTKINLNTNVLDTLDDLGKPSRIGIGLSTIL